MFWMFKDCTSLISVQGFRNLDTSKITDIEEMFYGCTSLISLPDISYLNTSKLLPCIIFLKDVHR